MSERPTTSETEERIETYIGSFARKVYEEAKTATKQFRNKPTSPQRFLTQVKSLVLDYIKNCDQKIATKRSDNKLIIQTLINAWDQLSKSGSLHQQLKDEFVNLRMLGWKSTTKRPADEWIARADELEESFNSFPVAMKKVLNNIPKIYGRPPHESARRFVNQLAFAWYSLTGEHPKYGRSATKQNYFKEFLIILNKRVLPSDCKSDNDFDSFGVDAVKFARIQFNRVGTRVRKVPGKTRPFPDSK